MSFFKNPFKKPAPQQNAANPFPQFHTAKGWITRWEPGQTPSLDLNVPYAHIIIAEGPSDKTTVELDGNPDEFAVHRKGGVFSVVRTPSLDNRNIFSGGSSSVINNRRGHTIRVMNASNSVINTGTVVGNIITSSRHGDSINVVNSTLTGNIAIGTGSVVINNNASMPAAPCRVLIKTPPLGKVKAQLSGETALAIPVKQQEVTVGNEGATDIAVVAQTLNLVNEGTMQARATILGGFMNVISEGLIDLNAKGAFDGILLHLDGESTINTSGAADKYRVDGTGHGTVTHRGGCRSQSASSKGLFTCDIR